MKRILGLDLGTNSIGWALLNALESENGLVFNSIERAGSRIIPMDAAVLSDFDKGNSKSQTSERTHFRGVRRLRERHLLRRERLHRVLNILGFLPEHYLQEIDLENHPGKFLINVEPKLPWKLSYSGKFEFLFSSSFEEMLADFKVSQPQLVSDDRKIPYDWTIYYLRKKALREKISKEELAWLILNFNQKRGYYQLRGEDEEEKSNKLVEFHALKVVAVNATDQKKGKDTWYEVHLENGWIYRRVSNVPLDWVGKIKEFIVTTDIEDDGTPKVDKEGNVKRSFRAPKEDDWTLVKKKTEADIDKSKKTVGEYIYDTLLQYPSQKIKGKLVRTVERKFYKAELEAILMKQTEFHPELRDSNLYNKCIADLYPNNDSHRENIADRNFVHLFLNDIIFYQRPLKTKKSLISNCPFEYRKYKDLKTGEEKVSPIKCIAKSNPLYQEFRLWQFVCNLRIYQREKEIDGKLKVDVDITNEWLKNGDDYAALFEWLNDRKEIKQDVLMQSYFKQKKIKGQAVFPYRWNYVEEKSYPCNETRASILNRLEKAGISSDFLNKEREMALWHILYSVEDKYEIIKALESFREKNQLNDEFVEAFRKFPPFKKEYGAYSEKAIKKLLPLMRVGKFWDEMCIDPRTKVRIENIMTGEVDESIFERVREKAIHLSDVSHFQGLPVWLASYIVYNRHAEAQEILKWQTVEDLEAYINAFKQHSLRNPIVEQVVLETLRVVRDIWKEIGQIDEIHVELGREMKNPKDKRIKMTEQALENENTNLRIKQLLTEFINPEYEIENVRPYSPMQQEIFRIYEDSVLNSMEVPDEIMDVIKKFKESDIKKRPDKSEIMRYKLWLEQKYRSPYTGEIIPLGKLFTPAYEIEHVIPQSRYFDDSFSNKVICEAEVNKLKSNQLGYEFIKNHHGEKVMLGFGKVVEVFTVSEYEEFIKQNYGGSKNRTKMKKLLMEDIPEAFIERQLNDSRYISKVIKGLLSNIVREKEEQEAISKNVITCTGGVTDRLKRDWGINDVWNDIVFPRFDRLNRLTESERFTTYSERAQKYIPTMPLELQKGFNKKRIDHRHHAMDAIVIACATRNIVNYLNNESASKRAKFSRYDLQHLLCEKRRTDDKGNYTWLMKKPWGTFTQDTRQALDNIIVSFKQNLRVINKATNYYQHYDASGKKVFCKQTKGSNWAIRKPMHKETVFGNVNLRKVKYVRFSVALDTPEMLVDKVLKNKVKDLLSYKYEKKRIEKFFKDNANDWKKYDFAKVAVYYYTNDTKDRLIASRKPLDPSFNVKKIEENVTDTAIQRILLKHLENFGGKTDLAFSPEGIDEMNRSIKELNNGKYHQPIYKVRVCELQGNKFNIGVTGNKSTKYVEAAKGTNLYFAVYQTEDGKRTYDSVPLNVVIERQKQGLLSVPETDEDGNKLLFWLSPNDLVYLPTEDEMLNNRIEDNLDKGRIYKMVSCTKNEAHFIPCNIAYPIVPVLELGSNNKAQRSWTGEMIKESCLPIKVNRLGSVINRNKMDHY